MGKIDRYWRPDKSEIKRAVKRLLLTWANIIIFMTAGCSDSRQKEPDILMVNAVYPYGSTSKAFSHETVIRPLEEGGFQYVSNKMVDLREHNLWWHSDRLSKEEWEEAYGKE